MISILGLCAIYLICMVLLVQYKGDTSIANVTWVGGVLLVTLYTFFIKSSFLLQQVCIALLVSIWAIRLIVHAYWRYTGKDPRFTHWKWHGFTAFIINSTWVFGQLLMIGIMSLPTYFMNTEVPTSFTLVSILGIGIWLIGFYAEVCSDYQLLTFLKDPRNNGVILKTGLWRYSRHPNYFGEITLWWGIFCIAFSCLPFPYAILTIITPITITCFLLFITGIPLLERAMEKNSEYQQYKKETSMLIPWFVKK